MSARFSHARLVTHKYDLFMLSARNVESQLGDESERRSHRGVLSGAPRSLEAERPESAAVCEAEGISLKVFGHWQVKFKTEPLPPEHKLLYRRRVSSVLI